METWTAEEVQSNLLKLIKLVNEEHDYLRIVSEQGSVVVLSEKTYQDILVTLEFLSTPGLMNSLKTQTFPPLQEDSSYLN